MQEARARRPTLSGVCVRARAPADCGSTSGWTHACLILVVFFFFFVQMISNDDAMVRLGYEYGYIPRPSDLREEGIMTRTEERETHSIIIIISYRANGHGIIKEGGWVFPVHVFFFFFSSWFLLLSGFFLFKLCEVTPSEWVQLICCCSCNECAFVGRQPFRVYLAVRDAPVGDESTGPYLGVSMML